MHESLEYLLDLIKVTSEYAANTNNAEDYALAICCTRYFEQSLRCKYKEYAIVSIELSDPLWYDEGIYPTEVNKSKLQYLVGKYDDIVSSRWTNPILLCVPIEVYTWLDEQFGDDVYGVLPVYAIAGPNGGYTGKYISWIQLNKHIYLPRVLSE